MCRSVKILIPLSLILCWIAALVYAGTIVGTASLTVASATPTPSSTPTPGFPSPPTLTNAQVITPNSNPGGHCHIAGDGSTDDTSCIVTLLGIGDLDFKAGTYVINGQGSGGIASNIFVPSGRNILCENSSLPPTPANATVIIKVPTSDSFNSGNWHVFATWANGTFYGCEVQAIHYPNTVFTDAGNDICFIWNPTGDNLHVYANDFHGWPGFTGVICIGTGIGFTDWQSGSYAHNDDVSYNSFYDSQIRGVEPDYGKNIKITHNTFVNSGLESEIQDSRFTGETILFDSNTITFNLACHGQCGTGSVFDTGPGAGYVCHTPGGGFPCTPGTNPPADYSGNTWSNNTVIGTNGIRVWTNITTVCTGDQNPDIVGVYRNNTCTSGNNCTVECPPGNANANFWGPGTTNPPGW